MLIDQLRRCAFHSHDASVEELHLSLQPDAIHQKDGYQRFSLSKVLQELVLLKMEALTSKLVRKYIAEIHFVSLAESGQYFVHISFALAAKKRHSMPASGTHRPYYWHANNTARNLPPALLPTPEVY